MWTPYAQPTGSIVNALNRLREHLERVPQAMINLSIDELTDKVPGKWSRLELLGHLIDSALNNLKRFTDAQVGEGAYAVQGYDQDGLVIANHYHDLPLVHLLTLWGALNMQILYVAEAMPAEALNKPLWFGRGEAMDKSVGWLIEDYVAHLEHHLKTLL